MVASNEDIVSAYPADNNSMSGYDCVESEISSKSLMTPTKPPPMIPYDRSDSPNMSKEPLMTSRGRIIKKPERLDL